MEEMKCNVCGSAVNAGDSFCQNCGSPIAGDEVQQKTVSVAEEVSEVKTEAESETMAESAEPEKAPETTVLSGGNPFSIQSKEEDSASTESSIQTSAVDEAVNASTASSGPVYQEMPGSDMQTSYQGTYTADTYVQPDIPAKKPGKGLGIAALILGIIGLLTSCCFGGYIFGLIGMILAIVCLAKKGSKGLGISGLVISALSFLLSLAVTIMMLVFPAFLEQVVPDDYDYILDELGLNDYDDYDYDYDDYDYDDYDYDYDFSSSDVTGTNQIKVGSILYDLPADFSSLALSVNSEYSSDSVTDIETYGLESGEYEFVLLDTEDGYSFWGYIENTGDATVYSVYDLQLTGINVDNYSACTAYSCEVYGGITLYMSRSEVEARIGTADGEDSGMDYYESESGNECLRIEYDENDYVCALDVTVY